MMQTLNKQECWSRNLEGLFPLSCVAVRLVHSCMRPAKHGKLAACTGAQRSLASLCRPWASPKDFANSPVPASATSQLDTVAPKIVFADSSSPVLWRRHWLV